MAHHGDDNENVVRDRLLLPLLLPLAALAATAVLIVVIGEILLATGGTHYDIGGQEVVLPVFAALAISLIVLGGTILAARLWGKDDQ